MGGDNNFIALYDFKRCSSDILTIGVDSLFSANHYVRFFMKFSLNCVRVSLTFRVYGIAMEFSQIKISIRVAFRSS